MSVWDFIRESYIGAWAMLAGLGTWLVQNWPIVFVLLALACIGIGLVRESKHTTQDDNPPRLSQDDIAKLNAMNTHGTRMMPLDAGEMVELAQEWLKHCSESTTRPEHDESY